MFPEESCPSLGGDFQVLFIHVFLHFDLHDKILLLAKAGKMVPVAGLEPATFGFPWTCEL
jgi:hypothetical protein